MIISEISQAPAAGGWFWVLSLSGIGVHITAGSTGSGAGIELAISGAAHIGTSDAYMTDAQAKRNPQIINVPRRSLRKQSTITCRDKNPTTPKLDGPVASTPARLARGTTRQFSVSIQV
jgi:phosphate transport system substrate-binding protein